MIQFLQKELLDLTACENWLIKDLRRVTQKRKDTADLLCDLQSSSGFGATEEDQDADSENSKSTCATGDTDRDDAALSA